MTADGEPCNKRLEDQQSHIRAQEESWDLHCAFDSGYVVLLIFVECLNLCRRPSFCKLMRGLWRLGWTSPLSQIGLASSLCGLGSIGSKMRPNSLRPQSSRLDLFEAFTAYRKDSHMTELGNYGILLYTTTTHVYSTGLSTQMY